MPSELETAMRKLDTKVSVMEMQINKVPTDWPKREQWHALIKLANDALDEYYKKENIGHAVKKLR